MQPLARHLLETALYKFRGSHKPSMVTAILRNVASPGPIFPRTTPIVLGPPLSLRFFSSASFRQQQQQQPVPTPSPPALLPTSVSPTPTTSSLSLFPRLQQQPSHYVTIHINSFPFLVTPGDLVTLPFRLPDVQVGDILRLTHASLLGSRDFTLKGSPWIEEDWFELRARVMEVTSEPMRFKVKTKQRNRRKKTVKSKHKYTVLRIGELVLKGGNAVGVGAEAEVNMEEAE